MTNILQNAAANGTPAQIHALLDSGADLNTKADNGMTHLHHVLCHWTGCPHD